MSTFRNPPTIRGWGAVTLPLLGGYLFGGHIPPEFVESGRGTFLTERVPVGVWILGGLIILLCAAGCLEAFRRGCWADRAIACIGALLTFWLLGEYCELLLLPVRPSPV
ncbi:MAG: hypothetical protein NT154_00500 [Verrucomicrobia bacterium]|nr:hypothetical protein [Verrucomicrobiota bacterium]